MAAPIWTPTHDEVAQYLSVRGVSTATIGKILDVHPNTVGQYLIDVRMRRTDYQATLIKNCEADLNELGIDLNDALGAILDDA